MMSSFVRQQAPIRTVFKTTAPGKTAQAYLKALRQNQSALLVAPTWAEIEAVTERIRTSLKSSGALSGDEKDFRVFNSLSWTDAQKRDARQYRPGMMLRFHQAKDGFERGETVEVEIAGDALTVRRNDGLTMPMNPALLANGSVKLCGRTPFCPHNKQFTPLAETCHTTTSRLMKTTDMESPSAESQRNACHD